MKLVSTSILFVVLAVVLSMAGVARASTSLSISEASPATGLLTVTVTGAANHSIIVQTSSSLSPVNWTNLSTNTLNAGGTFQLNVDPAGVSQRYFLASDAGVFSLNIVGFLNLTMSPGFSLLSRPLLDSTNTVATLRTNLPNGLSIFKVSTNGFVGANLLSAWSDPSLNLAPGEGYFVNNPYQSNIVLTLKGEVLHGALTNRLPAGLSVCSSIVAQSGVPNLDLFFPVSDGDTLLLWHSGAAGYDVYYYDLGCACWDPVDPVVNVGQSFWIQKSVGVDWVRNSSPSGGNYFVRQIPAISTVAQVNFFTYNVNSNFGRAFNYDGVTPLSNGFSGQLYAGTNGTAFQSVGSPASFLSGPGAGYINSGPIAIPGADGGQTVYLQLRVWETARGATFEMASTNGSKLGRSGLASVQAWSASTGVYPPNANGFPSFTLSTMPSIITQPQSQSVVAETSVSFSVVADGLPAPGYQWFFNGANPIAGATNATLTLPHVRAIDAGNYTVVAANAAGSVTSAVAVLSVQVLALIHVNGQVDPMDQFTVTNSAVVDVQSVFPNDHIFYTLDGSDPSSGALYTGSFVVTQSVLVSAAAYSSNYAQSAQAEPVTINVLTAPRIIQQPQSHSTGAGSPTTFSVLAGGSAPFTYQWRFNGTPIPGATNVMLLLNNPQAPDAGSYSVTVANPVRSTNSANANLTVLDPPGATGLPPSSTVDPGNTAGFCVTDVGTPPFKNQWRKNGVNLRGETNNCLLINSVQPPDGATYSVVTANGAGANTSTGMVLTVTGPQSIAGGDNFGARVSIFTTNSSAAGNNLAATREAGEPYHAGKQGSNSVWYTWSAPASGIATFNTIGSAFDTLLAVYTGTNVNMLTPVTSDDDSGGFYTSVVRFNAQAGTAYQIAIDGFAGGRGNFVLNWQVESAATVPTVSAQPASQTVRLGSNVTFSVSVAPPTNGLSYRWYFQGQALAGATNTSFTRTNVQAQHVGAYTVRISNNSGKTNESQAAILEIGPLANVQSQDKFEDLFGLSAPPFFSANAGGLKQAVASDPIITPQAGTTDGQIFTTTNSVTQSFEPNPCGVIGGASRWFTVNPAANATLVIDTYGSSFDTVLAVYTPASLVSHSNRLVACNMSSPGAHGTRVDFPATNGVYYFIAVDGASGDSGTVHLNWGLGLAPTNNPQIPPNQMRSWANGNLSITAATNGTPAPSVQWFRNQTLLNGETNPTLFLNKLQTSQAGAYSAVLSNFVGTVTNTVANVQVLTTFSNLVASTFDHDAEAWSLAGGAGSPAFHATGGSSGGYISTANPASGAWYWVAPPSYYTNQSGAYGGLLQFALEESQASAQAAPPAIVLSGGGVLLYYNMIMNPGTSWTFYNIGLDETSPWVNGQTGTPATQVEMLRTLASLTNLQIRLETSALAGSEGLDNVALLAPTSNTAAILKLRKVAQQYTIEWPATATGFNLQAATVLSPTTSWTNTAIPVPVNGLNTAILAPGTYYRLRKS